MSTTYTLPETDTQEYARMRAEAEADLTRTRCEQERRVSRARLLLSRADTRVGIAIGMALTPAVLVTRLHRSSRVLRLLLREMRELRCMDGQLGYPPLVHTEIRDLRRVPAVAS